MGGDFFFGGLVFDVRGKLITQNRPYRGTKLMGGASRGRMLFFDPENRLDTNQHTHGKIEKIDEQDWPYWKEIVKQTLHLAGIEIKDDLIPVNDLKIELSPDKFKLIVAKGGLKGYESH